MKVLLPTLIGAAIGAGLGALAGLLARASDKAWAFISSPGRGAIFGLVVGVIFAVYFSTPSGWTKGNVPELATESFNEAIDGDIPVIVDFDSETCPACRQLAPRVERLAEEYEGRVLVARVDVAKEPGLADRYGIRVVPTLVYFAAGKRTGVTEGAIAYRTLRNRADALIVEHAAATQDAPAEPEPADGALTEETPTEVMPD